MKSKNAIILAAGMSSRFAPLSFEKPKALIRVKDEILIERQIKQLQEAGISDITLVVGYKHEMFEYLKEKFDIQIVVNQEYDVKNNLSSIYCVKDKLSDTYICSADNYFTQNVFIENVDSAYYSAEFADGYTDEWCLDTDNNGIITGIKIGGANSWYMIGHAFFSKVFSQTFKQVIEKVYKQEESSNFLWEHVYALNLNKLKMKIKKFPNGIIKEFDSLNELRVFDENYIFNSGSQILRQISHELKCEEGDITDIFPIVSMGNTTGFNFILNEQCFEYNYEDSQIQGVNK